MPSPIILYDGDTKSTKIGYPNGFGGHIVNVKQTPVYPIPIELPNIVYDGYDPLRNSNIKQAYNVIWNTEKIQYLEANSNSMEFTFRLEFSDRDSDQTISPHCRTFTLVLSSPEFDYDNNQFSFIPNCNQIQVLYPRERKSKIAI